MIQSDNKLEFVNEVIKQLLDKFEIWHQWVSPYRSQANGMIERFNRTLDEALSKLEEVHNWDKFVKPILISYNMSQQESIQLILYYLIFGRDLKLPIKKVILSEKTILDRIIELIHKIPIFRENTKIAINRV